MKPSLISILKPYSISVCVLAVFALVANSFTLVIPQLISRGIDAYMVGEFVLTSSVTHFSLIAFGIFLFTYLQTIVQVYTAERVARDVRQKLTDRISDFSFARLEKETASKLLTHLTSDIDAIKEFIAFAVSLVISSIVLIIGATVLLLLIDWRLALAVLTILPLIGIVFFLVFSSLEPLFKKGQEVIDDLNRIINENVIGAALIRVFDSHKRESDKFIATNTASKDVGMKVLTLFSFVIPSIGLISNLASLTILALGGHFVITGTLSLGDFTAFNSYVFILIFPLIMLGFMSSVISRAQASYARIAEILNTPEEEERGTLETPLQGEVEVKGISLVYGEKSVLKNVSFKVQAGGKLALIGPTAAGKTQLLHVLMGLIEPTEGMVFYDNKAITEYKKSALHAQVALVFQDSVMFNMSIRENIGFSLSARDEDIEKAIQAAELGDFIDTLPQGLDSVISERGTSLSGGQKQRIMLARALALNPKVLLLDDFTARVDTQTEQNILKNIEKSYPDLTLISVTQKIHSAEGFDSIVLLMEGEALAQGTHEELSTSSPEYAQIIASQKSTHAYE